ncbi:MAG: glycosyltransferase family 2 protein [Candidatus Omnitrophota bacterium]|jgi:GT2 family glycosyltransferase|nr:MAG: glycosyltransferase family 2 protein [Candidatus Omnitrophota bacterium]
MIKLSIIIPNWNSEEYILDCLKSIHNNCQVQPFETIIVDNASSDNSVKLITGLYPEIRLIQNNDNLGFTKAVNMGIDNARGEIILLLNNDTVVINKAIDKMYGFLRENEQIAAVSCQFLNPDKTIQRSCMNFPGPGAIFFHGTILNELFKNNPFVKKYFMHGWDHNTTCRIDQPPAACLMTRKEVFKKIGLFDENFYLYFSDVDWCKRLKENGLAVYFLSDCQIIHLCGASTKKINMFKFWHRDRFNYVKKHFNRFIFLVYVIVISLTLIIKKISGRISLR